MLLFSSVRKMTGTSGLLTALQSLIRLFDRRPAYYEPDKICQLLQIWKIIFQCYSPKVPAADYEGKELIRIKQILSYLDQNFMNHITLEDISSVINLCPGECSRLFRRYMNVTLFSYLKEIQNFKKPGFSCRTRPVLSQKSPLCQVFQIRTIIRRCFAA